MTDSSRAQGILICVGAVVLGALFLLGLVEGSWWAVAIPVGILLAFVLGLTFWVGWTIATIQVEPESDAGREPPPATAATESDA
jgi:hypothetical protein